MLSLTIKEGEKIWIGDKIQVGVYDIRNGRVVLWIEAPKNITILRDKLFQESRRNATISEKDSANNSAAPPTADGDGEQRG